MLIEKAIEEMSTALKGKFEFVGHPKNGEIPGMEFEKGKFGYINFRTMTAERAAELVAAGFPYLKAVNAESKKAAEKKD